MDRKSPEIQQITTLFKGREDVFAIRWEKGSKSGYMPAYHFDPYHYRIYFVLFYKKGYAECWGLLCHDIQILRFVINLFQKGHDFK